MGAYVSGAKGGRVEEKRPDFKAGVLMAARHEWIASIRMMHVEGVIRVCSKKYGSLDVVIPDLAPSPTSTERIITDTAAMLEAEGFGPRIFCFKSPTSPVHDTILFMYSVDQVSWTDGEWDRNNDDRCIRKAKLQMKLLGGQFALDLESEEPHELTVLGAEILKRIYVVASGCNITGYATTFQPGGDPKRDAVAKIDYEFYAAWRKKNPHVAAWLVIQNGRLCGLGNSREAAYNSAYQDPQFDGSADRLCIPT